MWAAANCTSGAACQCPWQKFGINANWNLDLIELSNLDCKDPLYAYMVNIRWFRSHWWQTVCHRWRTARHHQYVCAVCPSWVVFYAKNWFGRLFSFWALVTPDFASPVHYWQHTERHKWQNICVSVCHQCERPKFWQSSTHIRIACSQISRETTVLVSQLVDIESKINECRSNFFKACKKFIFHCFTDETSMKEYFGSSNEAKLAGLFM